MKLIAQQMKQAVEYQAKIGAGSSISKDSTLSKGNIISRGRSYTGDQPVRHNLNL